MAAQAAQHPPLGSVEWFGPGAVAAGGAVAGDAAAAGFARQVSMTAVAHHVAPGAAAGRLDPLAPNGPSAYDSVRVLGAAIKAAYAAAGSVPGTA